MTLPFRKASSQSQGQDVIKVDYQESQLSQTARGSMTTEAFVRARAFTLGLLGPDYWRAKMALSDTKAAWGELIKSPRSICR